MTAAEPIKNLLLHESDRKMYVYIPIELGGVASYTYMDAVVIFVRDRKITMKEQIEKAFNALEAISEENLDKEFTLEQQRLFELAYLYVGRLRVTIKQEKRSLISQIKELF